MANKQIKFIEEIPFKPKDILSSFDVMGMSSQEFGIYCKLLFVSWIQRPFQCYLEYNEDNICELCNITAEDWEKCKPKVLKKFKKQTINDVVYMYNDVLLERFQEACVGTKQNKTKQLSIQAELLNYSFDDFWDDYDKKIGDKTRILPKWLELSDADREAVRIDIPKRKAAQPDKKWRPKPENYIVGRLWENEIIDYRNNEQGNSNTKQHSTYNAEGLSQFNSIITELPEK